MNAFEGVANIADDITVHGRNMQEHDRRLFAVLDKLGEVGLTLNGKKCQIRLVKINFFGPKLEIDKAEELTLERRSSQQ